MDGGPVVNVIILELKKVCSDVWTCTLVNVTTISGETGRRKDWTVEMVKEYQELFRKGTPRGPYFKEESFNLYR